MRKQHSIQQLENCEIGPDADGQGQYRGGRESGRLAQLPKCISRVVPDAAKNHSRIGEHDIFFGHGRIAETRQGIAPCMLGRHPLGKIVLNPQLDVRL